ncbi:terpene synthase family protein [Nonomuraea sp. C10]|uniref:terpene synthase family protein n=1 Tax=Nonomuraea sp. C10 TaxID=2600577 RepID=UPI0011CE63E9|nr:terpene synthase family protein [Nonomuraea sp. C10]TXK39796.1 terpene synthase [Nonomuraea sp. C10]
MNDPGALFATGRTCALAVAGGRDLERHAARYEGLFPRESFDSGLFGSLAMAGAFGSPWASPASLRVVNRASLLVFAVDRLFDEEAAARDDVAALTSTCLAAADGFPAASPVARFVGDLRAELGTVAAFAALEPAWRERLELMVAAMAREWEWSRGGGRPSPEKYLSNADSSGALFIAVSHWIYTGEVTTPEDLAELRAAGETVQRYLRLLNDLATHRRESASGDVNALTLGMTADEVRTRMAELAREAAELIGPLRDSRPRAADHLWWQIHYSAGFYGLSDFWASGAA